MILATTATESNVETAFKSFNIQASPIAFDILSSKLYSNTTLAIVRELLSNAYDAMAEADTLSTKKIEVHFPDMIEPEFTIRDYGNGLSESEIFNLYTTFFQSTKRDSNEFTGCYGLGSKSPFAYCDSFMVESYQDGIAKKYLMAKIEGYPKVTKLEEKETDNSNGLSVTVPVTKDDREFFKEFEWYIKYQNDLGTAIDANIEFQVMKPESEIQIGFSTIRLYKESNRYSTKVFIKQGMNVFSHEYRSPTCGLTIVAEVPIGTFDIVPSREHLSESGENKVKLKLVEQHIAQALEQMLSSHGPHSPFIYNAELEHEMAALLRNKYFPFPSFCTIYQYWNNGSSLKGYHYERAFNNRTVYTGFIAGLEPVKRTAGDPLRLEDEEVSDDVPYVIVVASEDDTRWGKVKRKLSACDALSISDVRVKRFCFDRWNDDHCARNYAALPICKESLENTKIGKWPDFLDPAKAYEYLLNIVWTYNSIPELNFRISVMTISQFLKKYKSNKIAGKKKAPPVNTRVGIVNLKDPYDCIPSYISNLPLKDHLSKWDILGVVLKKNYPEDFIIKCLSVLFTCGFKNSKGEKIVEQALLNQNILCKLNKHVLILSSKAYEEALTLGLKPIDFNKLLEDIKEMDIQLYKESSGMSESIKTVNKMFEADHKDRRIRGIRMPMKLINRIKNSKFYKMHLCYSKLVSKVKDNTVDSSYYWNLLSDFFIRYPRVKMSTTKSIVVSTRLVRFYNYVSKNFSSYFGNASREEYYRVADYILNNKQHL